MTESIPWGRLPNISRTMIEYTRGNRDVISLVGGDWTETGVRKSALERRTRMQRLPDLGDALREGYKDVKIPEAVHSNLELLNDPKTVCIVTGQQVGIFGGPLFTYYKALSSIILSRKFEKEIGRPVVPVFWMETADADFGEINRIAFPPYIQSTHLSVYTPRDLAAGISVSYHKLTEEIDEVRSDLVNWLSDLPHGKPLINIVKEAYQPGKHISQSFREIMTAYLGDIGLVMIDPLHRSMIERSAGFWEVALEKPEKLNQAFNIASRELKNNRLPLQVRLRDDALPILHIDENGIRKRVIGLSEKWKIGPDGDEFDDDELRRIARDKPASLTPSVLLRPLLQDWLLPTWIYVAGPAEIAYQAQIGRCYDFLNIPRPLVAPRMSVTLVVPAARRLLTRHKWTVDDVLGGQEILLRSKGTQDSMEALFDGGAEHLRGWLERIERACDEAAVNSSAEIDVAGRKLIYQWDKLKRITLNKLIERNRVRLEHAEKVSDMILPDGMLQERHDNVLYYLAAYGTELGNILAAETNLFEPSHRIIDLESAG